MAYKHGIYTESVTTAGKLQARELGTVPVYIGTAPIGEKNLPVLINSFSEFVDKFGNSDFWETYTLCEAAYAHFKNAIQTISPIIVINIFDKSKHKVAGTATSVTFTNKVGYLDNADGKIILSSLTATPTGFTAVDNGDGRIKITYPASVTITGNSVSFSFDKADISKVDASDFDMGLAMIDKAPIKCGVAPSIICAPVFSETYAEKMIAKCVEKISKKWECVAYIDIPTASNTTIDSALTYKSTSALNSKYARLHYPMSKYNGKVFHLSVLDAVASQIVDNENDGVACRSSSNKPIMCDAPVLNSTTELTYSEEAANRLNAKGITTINYIGGSFRLWGGHMANYDYDKIDNIEAKDRSDATVRMQVFLANWLKREHIDSIDAPLTRRDIDNIVSNVNIGLNSFVNSGYLLKGECYFADVDNPMTELADGNLVLDVLHTEVPNGKSISFQLQYDVSGLETLYKSEEV